MDVASVEAHSGAYIRVDGGSDLGSYGVPPGCRDVLSYVDCAARCPWYRRGWLHGNSVLPEFLLQTRRACIPDCYFHIWYVIPFWGGKGEKLTTLAAAPLATTFASTLAWLIVKFAEFGPIAPWRLLFIIEGFPSVIASVVAWNVIPDSPQTAPYLTKREKKVAHLRLRSEQSTATNNKPSSGLKGRDVLAIFRDPVAWITATMFFLTNMAYSSLPVFLPKILTEMGHDTLTSQALSAPPYLAAFVIVLFTAHMSDRLRTRTVPLIFHALASSSGYAILALAKPLDLPNFIRYMAVYPAAIGFFNVVTLIITWSINNQANQSRQGGGFALLQLVGQCGPLVGTRLYPDRDAPYYAPGMSTCAIAMLLVSILAYALRFYLKYQNRKFDRAESERQQGGGEVEEEGLVGPGRRRSAAVVFRYML